MKTKILTTLTVLCVVGLLLPGLAQASTNAPVQNYAAPEMPDQATQSSTKTDMQNGAAKTVPSAFAPPAQPVSTGSDELRLNFRNAPLDEVLNYLSDAAGFIVVVDTHISGNVTVISTHPLSRDEAVNLLNTELNRNGYAAIRNGRALTVVDKKSAKTRNIPVKTGNNPEAIPDNDEIATWIIPIRFVEVRQLVSDLSPLVSAQATVAANEAGNSIVIADTQSNIRHLAKIIQAVDNSARAGTEIRVFRLKYANPTDVANELSGVFPTSNSSGDQVPIMFGDTDGQPDFGPPSVLDGIETTSSSNQKATLVTAVADSRLQAVIVSAPQNLMDQIAGIMTTLDMPSDRDQHVTVIQLKNGDPQQVAQVLQSLFSNGNTSSTGTSSQSSALQTRRQQAVTTMSQTTASSGLGSPGSSGGSGGNGGL
jgi:type II secretory pathway component GspD/PulD (secretin)